MPDVEDEDEGKNEGVKREAEEGFFLSLVVYIQLCTM